MPARLDFQTIGDWIRPGAHVLDLGCGDGALLNYLRETRNATGYGVEISDTRVLASIANGVDVIQTDLEAGLSGFESGSFDYVILSQTIQAVRNSELIMREMMRVARQGIVTFPNFGHWRHRFDILRGHMPVSKALPYQWFDTPNIHLCTLSDFELLCARLNLRVLNRVVLNENQQVVNTLPNLLGSLAMYRFESSSAPS
jgi:methionine biosynthesis protein MetW